MATMPATTLLLISPLGGVMNHVYPAYARALPGPARSTPLPGATSSARYTRLMTRLALFDDLLEDNGSGNRHGIAQQQA